MVDAEDRWLENGGVHTWVVLIRDRYTEKPSQPLAKKVVHVRGLVEVAERRDKLG